jgi:hypothetical protein
VTSHQTPSAAAPPDEEGPADGAKPEDALVFFQQQTSSMDREALLARVAEAAAKEADAVTKLGQLTCVGGVYFNPGALSDRFATLCVFHAPGVCSTRSATPP